MRIGLLLAAGAAALLATGCSSICGTCCEEAPAKCCEKNACKGMDCCKGNSNSCKSKKVKKDECCN